MCACLLYAEKYGKTLHCHFSAKRDKNKRHLVVRRDTLVAIPPVRRRMSEILSFSHQEGVEGGRKLKGGEGERKEVTEIKTGERKGKKNCQESSERATPDF